MRCPRPALLCLAVAVPASQAQTLPFDQMAPTDRAMAEDILGRANFDFTSRTEPRRVRSATMEKLFDHPRMSVAMWRQCQFVPAFHAVEISSRQWKLDDTRGLRADLRLIYAKPGWRIYLVDGTAAKGRLAAPFAVSARMVASYRYWEDGKGFESEIRTWTLLDSALLGFMARPFHGYIKSKQDQFTAYINGNIASFGEAADLAPGDFQERLRQEGDEASLRAYQSLFEIRR